jgi:hypothetical protein
MTLCRFELQEGLRKYRGEGQRDLRSTNQVDFLLVEQSAEPQDGYAVFFLDVRNRVSTREVRKRFQALSVCVSLTGTAAAALKLVCKTQNLRF